MNCIEIEAIRSHGRVWKYKGTAKVEGKRMADGVVSDYSRWSKMIHSSSVVDKKAK